MTEKCCFHCIYAQSNEDGLHCYKENRVRVDSNNVCEDFEGVGSSKNDEFKETNIPYTLWVLKKTVNDFDELHKMYVEQVEENKELEQRNRQLKKSNRQLKKSIKRQQDSNNECAKLIKEQQKENEQLKSDNEWLLQCIKNQSAIIQELDNVIMAYNMEHKITIKLTEKDLKTLDKALSYYTHQKVEE